MMLYLLIGLGGALGSMARYWLSGLVDTHIDETFPWGTLLINITGSFIIGFFSTLTGPGGRYLAGTESRVFVMTGLCGGFTTFSAFSLQTLALARGGEWLRAGGNVAGSVVTCLVAVWLGHMLAAYLNTQRAT
jgi:fluoride exporter